MNQFTIDPEACARRIARLLQFARKPVPIKALPESLLMDGRSVAAGLRLLADLGLVRVGDSLAEWRR